MKNRRHRQPPADAAAAPAAATSFSSAGAGAADDLWATQMIALVGRFTKALELFVASSRPADTPALEAEFANIAACAEASPSADPKRTAVVAGLCAACRSYEHATRLKREFLLEIDTGGQESARFLKLLEEL